jgi:hypothetical protein
MNKKPEYVEGRKAFENFENAMTALMKVPHSEIKAQLDAERAAKQSKKRQAKEKQEPAGRQ